MAITDWPAAERPRERLLAHGPAALSDAELLAIYLRVGVRGKSAVDEINELVESRDISVLVIGLRKRTAVGKLILGSVAQELLMTVSCPVLCVKAPGA